MRIGIMTGGGDAPGLNGIIEASSRALIGSGHQVLGILDGFDGVFSNRTREIKWNEITGIHAVAGTFLGTSNKTKLDGRSEEFQTQFANLKLDGLIAAGGDGTFIALKKIAPNIPIIGVPKTIDNDLQGTEVTFGFDTAISVVSDAVDALRTTANSHHRVMVVETMGRTAGWIALGGGLASYADAVLIPERPFSKPHLAAFLQRRKNEGVPGMVIVVSEAAMAEGENPVFNEVADSTHGIRYGGIAERIARWIEANTTWEARHVVLGHLQRSRAPTTTDRFLTAAMGLKAASLASEKKWGSAVVYREGRVLEAPLSDIQGPPRRVDPDHRWVQSCRSLGIFI